MLFLAFLGIDLVLVEGAFFFFSSCLRFFSTTRSGLESVPPRISIRSATNYESVFFVSLRTAVVTSLRTLTWELLPSISILSTTFKVIWRLRFVAIGVESKARDWGFVGIVGRVFVVLEELIDKLVDELAKELAFVDKLTFVEGTYIDGRVVFLPSKSTILVGIILGRRDVILPLERAFLAASSASFCANRSRATATYLAYTIWSLAS